MAGTTIHVDEFPNPWATSPNQRWKQNTDIRNRKPLSNACLNALGAAAREKGRPLTDAESAAIQKEFERGNQ